MLSHQLLMDTLIAELSAAPMLVDGGISRQRARPLPEVFTGAINVRILRSDPEPLAGIGAPITWSTRVAFECIGRASSSTAPDEVAAPVFEALHLRLASSVVALAAAGFELDLSPTLQWDQDEQEDRIGAIVAIYNVRHSTSPYTMT